MTRTIFDTINDLCQEVSELNGRHAELEARMERVFRKGKVTDVDAENQLYRQEIGLDDDGNSVKSPWVPYAQIAGARKEHSPPSVGQTMILVSPDGDHEQAHGIPLTFSDNNPSPSKDGDTDMSTRGKCSDTTTTKDGDRRNITVGSASFEVTDGKIVLTANDIELIGNIKLGSSDASRELALKGSIDSAGDTEQSELSTKVKAI